MWGYLFVLCWVQGCARTWDFGHVGPLIRALLGTKLRAYMGLRPCGATYSCSAGYKVVRVHGTSAMWGHLFVLCWVQSCARTWDFGHVGLFMRALLGTKLCAYMGLRPCGALLGTIGPQSMTYESTIAYVPVAVPVLLGGPFRAPPSDPPKWARGPRRLKKKIGYL